MTTHCLLITWPANDTKSLLWQCLTKGIKPRNGVTSECLKVQFVSCFAQDLLACCEEGTGEIQEALDVMLMVPKKANDAMHLSMLDGFEVSKHTHLVK